MQKGDQGENGWSFHRVPMQQFSISRIIQEAGFGEFSWEFAGLGRRASEVVLGNFLPKMFV